MTVKAHPALLVGVFVVALLAVSLVQRDLVGDLAGVARDATRSHAPRARPARELRAAHLAECRALAVLLCDIDRFKLVNDTRGHAAGDEVLRVVAGPAADPRTFTPEGQDAARYRWREVARRVTWKRGSGWPTSR